MRLNSFNGGPVLGDGVTGRDVTRWYEGVKHKQGEGTQVDGTKFDVGMYCGVCRRALMRLRLGGEVTWEHTPGFNRKFDHAARPVHITELDSPPIMLCDFCSGEPVIFFYHCQPIDLDLERQGERVVGQNQVHEGRYKNKIRNLTGREAQRMGREFFGGVTQHLGEYWAACQPCSEDIEAGDLYGVVGRCVDRLPSKLRNGRRLAETRARVIGTHEIFFATVECRFGIDAILGKGSDEGHASTSDPG
jgi:hypothetical protein